MKKQNSVYLSGQLAQLELRQVVLGEQATEAVYATLVTDHPSYGGYHQVIFLADLARELLAYAALVAAPLEVTVEGWLRSTSGCAVVICDRMMILNATQQARAAVARRKAEHKAARKAVNDRPRTESP